MKNFPIRSFSHQSYIKIYDSFFFVFTQTVFHFSMHNIEVSLLLGECNMLWSSRSIKNTPFISWWYKCKIMTNKKYEVKEKSNKKMAPLLIFFRFVIYDFYFTRIKGKIFYFYYFLLFFHYFTPIISIWDIHSFFLCSRTDI